MIQNGLSRVDSPDPSPENAGWLGHPVTWNCHKINWACRSNSWLTWPKQVKPISSHVGHPNKKGKWKGTIPLSPIPSLSPFHSLKSYNSLFLSTWHSPSSLFTCCPMKLWKHLKVAGSNENRDHEWESRQGDQHEAMELQYDSRR